MHLVRFIIRIYHDARSSECQLSILICIEIKLYAQEGTVSCFSFTYRNKVFCDEVYWTKVVNLIFTLNNVDIMLECR